ncbi:ATP-binding protein [Thermococcus indicus]|uniref:ATP-binding protein n=1 Tax=Thermococcus indicus TaxID=2586643 RepID=A0A4Y5SMV6_9EURY|nr:ATP-binding protein [Thermococcus indicus]QDA31411.1 ATP-binding protein [Thermococcus indicus]
MLFSVEPKTSIKDVFGRKAEFLEFIEKLENGRRLFVITGPRRIGKTTFLYATLNELYRTKKIPYLIIDSRKAASINMYNPSKVITSDLELLSRDRFSRIVSRIEGISVRGYGIRLKSKPEELTEALEDINEKHELAVIAFDEAQYLRFARNDFTLLLSWVYDTLQNIAVVLTGSQVGVLEKFLRFGDYSAPLYGRYHVRIKLPRFNPSESLEFLERGFAEYGIEVPTRELLSAVRTLDGVPGWLTHYGAYRIDGSSHWDAIDSVLEEASGYVESEFRELDELSPRYRAIMEIVATITSSQPTARRRDILNALSLREGRGIDSKDMRKYLRNLVDYGFLEHTGYGEYYIPDPVVKRVFQR